MASSSVVKADMAPLDGEASRDDLSWRAPQAPPRREREQNSRASVQSDRAWSRQEPVEAESTLIQRCQAGDMKAAEALFRRYHAPVFQLVSRMLHGAPEAEDLTQDVFLKAFRAIGSFKGRSSFKTWIFQIATNTCLNHLAKAERRYIHDSLETPLGGEGDFTLGDRLASPSPEPDEAAMASEIYSRVQQAVSKLSPEFRAVLVLRDIQDLSYEEVSEALGLNLGTVKSRLARARKQVQQWLGDLF
ncbi:MAG TPA: sigma-70 family RNA polymerase sigma factor [Oscillatoriaceae cyanobacterium]